MFGGKIWGKVRPSSQNKRKNLGSSVSNFGVISEIQRAKFGVFVIYIFGGKIWGSNKNFRGKIWGQAPRPPNMEALGLLDELDTTWSGFLAPDWKVCCLLVDLKDLEKFYYYYYYYCCYYYYPVWGRPIYTRHPCWLLLARLPSFSTRTMHHHS